MISLEELLFLIFSDKLSKKYKYSSWIDEIDIWDIEINES